MDVAVLHHIPRALSISSTDTFSEWASERPSVCVYAVYPTPVHFHSLTTFIRTFTPNKKMVIVWMAYFFARAPLSLPLLSPSSLTVSSKHKFQLRFYILFSLARWFFFSFRDILSLSRRRQRRTNGNLFTIQRALSIPSVCRTIVNISISREHHGPTNYRSASIRVRMYCTYMLWCVIMQMEFHLCWLIHTALRILWHKTQTNKPTNISKTPINWRKEKENAYHLKVD